MIYTDIIYEALTPRIGIGGVSDWRIVLIWTLIVVYNMFLWQCCMHSTCDNYSSYCLSGVAMRQWGVWSWVIAVWHWKSGRKEDNSSHSMLMHLLWCSLNSAVRTLALTRGQIFLEGLSRCFPSAWCFSPAVSLYPCFFCGSWWVSFCAKC